MYVDKTKLAFEILRGLRLATTDERFHKYAGAAILASNEMQRAIDNFHEEVERVFNNALAM